MYSGVHIYITVAWDNEVCVYIIPDDKRSTTELTEPLCYPVAVAAIRNPNLTLNLTLTQ